MLQKVLIAHRKIILQPSDIACLYLKLIRQAFHSVPVVLQNPVHRKNTFHNPFGILLLPGRFFIHDIIRFIHIIACKHKDAFGIKYFIVLIIQARFYNFLSFSILSRLHPLWQTRVLHIHVWLKTHTVYHSSVRCVILTRCYLNPTYNFILLGTFAAFYKQILASTILPPSSSPYLSGASGVSIGKRF